MKNSLIFFLLIVFLCSFSFACAEYETLVSHGERYICGDSFEVIFPDEPYLTHMISRQPPKKAAKVHITAGKEDILLAVRIQLRNLTPETFMGLKASSFKLIGYVRNQPHQYTPEVMEPYDYGGIDSYKSYSKTYFKKEPLAPLRKADILLVFRVNPILRDWELLVEPKSREDPLTSYLDADYEPMELEKCKAVFQFVRLINSETGEITKYYRKDK